MFLYVKTFIYENYRRLSRLQSTEKQNTGNCALKENIALAKFQNKGIDLLVRTDSPQVVNIVC